MIRLVLRWIPLGLIISSVIVFVLVLISPVVPDKIGVVQAMGADSSSNIGTVFLDLDTGILSERLDRELVTLQQSPIPDTAFEILRSRTAEIDTAYYFDLEQETEQITFNVAVGDDLTQIATYDDFSPKRTFWHIVEESLYVVSVRDDVTTLYALSIADGALTTHANIPDFNAGFFNRSPDGHYLIMRENQGNIYSVTQVARQMFIVDLESYDVIGLGELDFAYWSPDSQTIAMGHVTDTRFIIDVSLYTVADGSVRDLEIQGYHPDLPFFDNYSEAASLIWKPDSSGFAISHEQAEQLIAVTLNGDMTVIDGVDLDPIRWSPNQRYLITYGSDGDGQRGAFIVDIQNETATHFAPDVTLNQLIPRTFDGVSVLWSPDSRFIVLAARRWVSVFNPQGDTVINRMAFYDGEGFLAFPPTVQWADGVSRHSHAP